VPVCIGFSIFVLLVLVLLLATGHQTHLKQFYIVFISALDVRVIGCSVPVRVSVSLLSYYLRREVHRSVAYVFVISQLLMILTIFKHLLRVKDLHYGGDHPYFRN
jgi:hypothetical protein